MVSLSVGWQSEGGSLGGALTTSQSYSASDFSQMKGAHWLEG
jgi:hypothetical protein